MVRSLPRLGCFGFEWVRRRILLSSKLPSCSKKSERMEVSIAVLRKEYFLFRVLIITKYFRVQKPGSQPLSTRLMIGQEAPLWHFGRMLNASPRFIAQTRWRAPGLVETKRPIQANGTVRPKNVSPPVAGRAKPGDEMRLCAGDWVEVRSKAEILSTLDENGRLEGFPFMPQMFQYCGQRMRVYKRAHKTCDTVSGAGGGAYVGRRLRGGVHLEHRCDGQAYGGCQAGCLIFGRRHGLSPSLATGAGQRWQAIGRRERSPIVRVARKMVSGVRPRILHRVGKQDIRVRPPSC